MLKHYLVASFAALILIVGSPAYAENPTTNTNTAAAVTAENANADDNTAATAGTAEGTAVTAEGTAEAAAVPASAKDMVFKEGAEGQITEEQFIPLVDELIKAIGDDAGPFAIIALVLMLFGFLLKKYLLPFLPVDKKFLPLLMMGFTVPGAIGYCMYSGASIGAGAQMAVIITLGAVGGWEAAMKHLIGAFSKSEKA